MAKRQPLVLIADDAKDMIMLLRRLFEKEGFEVVGAPDGITAYEEAISLRPDLILMDVAMPGAMDGFDVVRQLKQNEATARIPTIFITAAARQPSDVAVGLGLGADDYVFKPFNPRELLARARSKLRARQLEEHLERRNKELEALVRIGREFNQSLKLDDLLDLTLSICTQELPADQGLVCLFDQQEKITSWRIMVPGKWSKTDIQAIIDSDVSLFAEILRRRQAVLVNAVNEQPLFLDCCQSAVGTLISHHGSTLGLIILGHNEPEHYDEGHLRLLESITEQAALAIRNAELYAELRHYALNLENMVAEQTAELRAAQLQLIRSEKLASLGRLSAGIAHEVNNPLQAIRNCLELAIEDIDADRPVDRELLTVAGDDVKRIRRIVSQLLDFSRPGSGEMVLHDAGKLVKDILRLANRQLSRASIKLVEDIQRTPAVRVNEDQFKQVILNLVLNAQEAMPDGGTFYVSVWRKNEEIMLSFADTGVGIAEEDLDKIFDPFFSTKADGTGLGLAVSYGIIEAHGGRIEVESEPGEGARFTIHMPLGS